MKLIEIVIWTGDNYKEILGLIVKVNPEVKVKTINKRLIFCDNELEFHRNVIIGDMIKIAQRENIEEDEYETE